MLSFLLLLSDESQHDKIMYLYNKYHDEMIKFAKYKLSSTANVSYEAECAVQEAFLKIIEHIDTIDFSSSEQKLKAYVMAITANEAINIVRKVRYDVSIDEVYEESIYADDFINDVYTQQEYEKVVRAIMELDDRYSIPLQMRYVEEYSVKQISSLLDIPQNTVYTNIRRGLVLLRKKLGKGDLHYG